MDNPSFVPSTHVAHARWAHPEVAVDRDKFAARVRSVLEDSGLGVPRDVVLTGLEAFAVAMMLDVLAQDEGITDLGLVAADLASRVRPVF